MKTPVATSKKVPAAKKSSASSTHKTRNKPPDHFPIVAIGASAGGLEAITELLKNLPPDTGMSFIYVQHLSPDHKSMLTEILSKTTSMRVQEIYDMDKIKPNNVFIIPHDKGIEVTDGHIKLIPRTRNGVAISIDILFSSLAHAQKERVIGVILSGTASDGTIGMKTIKQEGGLTFAQDDSAKFASMPQSAIDAGAVDFVLSPKKIALELARLSKHPLLRPPLSKKRNDAKAHEDEIDDHNPDLKTILDYLHKARGVDFSAYKMNTIKRRILRRMLLYRLKTLREYANFLKGKSDEIDILYQDMLINVTRFFRDTDTHKYLKEILFPRLLKKKKPGESLRMWVPACATGEEAYSMAIMLLEIQEGKAVKIPVQIFATDLSLQAINKARIGLYTKQELEAVSAKRIQRFFTKSDGAYRINKSVRDMCVFAPHNILQDPPFSRLDFISCCNLFIYLDNAAQKKVIGTFYYALNDDGSLMLGKSETISAASNLFTGLNTKYKIFSRKINSGARALPVLSRPVLPKNNIIPGNLQKANTAVSKRAAPHNTNTIDSAIDAVLITDYMPASVAINQSMEIVQFRGATDLYLSHPKGKATFNILKMARPEIAFELRNAISKAMKTKQRVRKNGIEFKTDSAVRIVNIEAVPLKIESDEPLLLILFAEQDQVETFPHSGAKGKDRTIALDRKIKKLEAELAAAHADALSFSQEQETFTEELQSANEEVVSSNEELQTMNEELETSKEETESANEELITTNQELLMRNDMLNESYEYSEAIIGTIREPMIVLDKNFRIKSANNSFYKKFVMKEEDTVGALFFDLGNKQWNNPKLRELLQDIVPKKSNFHDFEIVHDFLHIGKRTMLLNASGIVQKIHREQLILLSISDVTEARELEVEKILIEKRAFKKDIDKQKQQSELLEETVKQRTSDLMQANFELERMNKEFQSFTFISSHDLQEPLRKIQTLASRILEKENTNLSDAGKNYFRLIQNSAERMRNLIQDLLSFSRLTTTEHKMELTDLNKIIEEVKEELNDVIAAKRANIEVKVTCEVTVIPFQFRQLIYNLISNSLKFSRSGIPCRIMIESHNIKKGKLKIAGAILGKEYCHLRISDNGIGFEEVFKEKIFEVFQRLHGRDEYEGTGIGLAIVKKIIENHDGIVTASGKINKGANFDIYIPT